MIDLFCIFKKPEYLALLISVLAVLINVYISNRNRKHSLAKEEYFKLQNVVEKIIAKLLILNNEQARLQTYLELVCKANIKPNSIFIDKNDTLNNDDFEKNGEEITAWIDIYFEDLGEEWNVCLNMMGDLNTQIFKLSKKLEWKEEVDWKIEIESFNKVSAELADKPKAMADKLKLFLKEYKKNNL